MYDLLGLLYDYSVRGRIADREFLDHVLSFYWSGLKGYLEHLSFEKIKQDNLSENLYCPMAYSFYEKSILVDEDIIKQNFPNVMLSFQSFGLDQLSSILAYNSRILAELLHEIDHSVQHKKGVEKKDTLEGKLLNLCFYPEIELLAQPTWRSKLINIFYPSHFVDILRSLKNVNDSFGRVAPFERLAQINSIKQVLGLLEVLDVDIKKIPDVLKWFKTFLLNQCFVGYENKDSVPLLSYLEEVKKLNYKELNKIICELENHFAEIDTVDDKVKYGLSISSSEFSSLAKRILR